MISTKVIIIIGLSLDLVGAFFLSIPMVFGSSKMIKYLEKIITPLEKVSDIKTSYLFSINKTKENLKWIVDEEYIHVLQCHAIMIAVSGIAIFISFAWNNKTYFLTPLILICSACYFIALINKKSSDLIETILVSVLCVPFIILPIGKLPFIYEYLSAELQLLVDRHWYIGLLAIACAFLISRLRKVISHVRKNKLLYYLLNIPTYLPAIILLYLMFPTQEDLNTIFLWSASIFSFGIFARVTLSELGKFVINLPSQFFLRILLYFFQWLERKNFEKRIGVVGLFLLCMGFSLQAYINWIQLV
ncbi:MAG: hypothetical protein K0U45_09240 [Alphaproteobacteria bacterium]|nr:hypothetical protein [Alphaproteobacteria bacterium]